MSDEEQLMPIASAVATCIAGIKSRVEWASEGAIPAREFQVLSDLITDLDEWLIVWKSKLTGGTEPE